MHGSRTFGVPHGVATTTLAMDNLPAIVERLRYWLGCNCRQILRNRVGSRAAPRRRGPMAAKS
jgi:hypothetical protein